MIAILDASAAAEILLLKPASSLFNDWLEKCDFVMAPDLFVPEITNTFLKYHHAGRLRQEECLSAIEEGIGFIDIFVPSRELWREVFSESARLRLPAYDMFYLVTARRNNGHLLTMDRKLIKLCRKNGVKVAE